MKRSSFSPPLLLLAANLSGCGFWDAFSDPRGDRAITVLDVTPAGEYLGAIDGRGAVAIWRLRTTERLRVPRLEMSGQPSPQLEPLNGFGFRGDTGEVLYECGSQWVCSIDITTGQSRELFDHGDPQDRVHLIASSSDGLRLTIGTLAGRVLTYNLKSGKLEERKHRDRWRSAGPLAIYTLEGMVDLSVFLTATVETTGANQYIADGGVVHEEGFVDMRTFKDVLWRGPVIWHFFGDEPDSGILRVGDVVRADFGPREDRIAICQEGGPRLVLDYPSLKERADLSLLGHNFTATCGGIRFLDEAGEWIGIIADGAAEMELCHMDAAGSWSCRDRFRLRRKPGSGARPLIALPEKRWFFVGLAQGGVDWYELDTEGKGRAQFLRHLSWND